jgi:hypothetical protein
MRFSVLSTIAALFSFVVVGCAVGTVADDGTEPAEPAAASGAAQDDASPPEQLASTEAGVPDAILGSHDAGGGDAATDSSAADTGAADTGSSASCAASNACSGATVVAQLSADTGADTRSAQGSTSEWLQVLATENDGSLGGHDLRIKATLDSPPGTTFDLFLYRGADAPALACGSAPTASSTLGSGTQTATDLWTDNYAHTDSKIITIEVRHISGSCSPSAQWTLTLTGNTN